MTDLLDPKPGTRPGSGHRIGLPGRGASPRSWEGPHIEIVEPLGKRACNSSAELGYRNVGVRIGDGYGLAAAGPFDAIIVTAAPAVSRNRSSIPEKGLRDFAWTDAAAEWRHRSGHGCSLRALLARPLAQAPEA